MKSLLALLLLSGLHYGACVLSEQTTFLHFAFPGFKTPVYHGEYEELFGPDVLKLCVRREYPPDQGDQCKRGSKVCLWGSQRCGPDNILEPTTRCNCKDNAWSCHPFLCPTMEPKCPQKPFLFGNDTDVAKPICKTDLLCGFEEKTCQGCNVTVPSIQCSCQAGQPFTCQEVDLCSTQASCTALQDAVKALEAPPGPELEEAIETSETSVISLFPEPVILEAKTTIPPPPNFKENDKSCPLATPDISVNSTATASTCSTDGVSCHYGYSCCCADGSQCSADIKCECINGVLECKEKTCDAFLCLGPPPLLTSPFPETELVIETSAICPSEDVALDTTTCVVSDEIQFYHCEYSFSCCCPNSPSGPDFSGRYCSSDLQCTCNSGFFTCDAAQCPECPVENDVVCPAEQPEDGTMCPNPAGETCGFGIVQCCNGVVHADVYCTCQGTGVWDCFDAKHLCEMEVCDEAEAVSQP